MAFLFGSSGDIRSRILQDVALIRRALAAVKHRGNEVLVVTAGRDDDAGHVHADEREGGGEGGKLQARA